jgi:hypothetical protein
MRAELPELRASIDGNDADRCVHLLPRVCELRRVAAAEAGRLLRVLFLRLGSLSPDPGQPVVLRDAGQPIGADDSCVEARADWASGLRGCVTSHITALAAPINKLIAIEGACHCTE